MENRKSEPAEAQLMLPIPEAPLSANMDCAENPDMIQRSEPSNMVTPKPEAAPPSRLEADSQSELDPPLEDTGQPVSKDVFHKLRFAPAVQFGPAVDQYKGKLILSPTTVFSVHVRRQKRGFYAVSGTISLLDPATGHLMQIAGDRRKEFNKRRNEKGLAPITGKHAFQSAIKKEINIKYQGNDNYTQAIKSEAIKIAQNLVNQHRDLITDRALTGVALENLPLGLIYDGFGSAYLGDRTKSDNMRAQYGRMIRQVADIMGESPLEEWSLSMLLRLSKKHPEINRDQIDEVLQFLDYVASHRNTKNPAAVCLQQYIDRIPRKKRNAKKEQQDATNAVVLPERAEDVLDKEAWDHLGDPRYLAYIMVKESGLSVDEICALKFKDIKLGPETEKVFIFLKRNYTKSATHNYSFPLFPCGAVYLRQYIRTLQEGSGDGRIGGDCYIISADNKGTKRYTENEVKGIKDFLNEMISKQKIGYAALTELKELKKESKGMSLLQRTYKNRITKIFSGDGALTNDDGAETFMCHKALINSVQSDHYRAFTDQTGRTYLFDSLCKDPRDPSRFLPNKEEHTFRRKSTRQLSETQKIINYPAKSGKCGQVLEVTLEGLYPGDVVTFETQHGLLVKNISQTG